MRRGPSVSGWASATTAPEPAAAARKLAAVDSRLGDVAGSPLGEQPFKGVFNARSGTVGHKNGCKMGPADDRASGDPFDLVEAHRQTEILQSLQEQLVSPRPVATKSFQLGLQGSLAWFDEVGERVHRPGRELARDFATWHEPNAEALGAGCRLGCAPQAVMVGERHCRAACRYRQLDNSFRSFRPV